jgi:hypothetical protein
MDELYQMEHEVRSKFLTFGWVSWNMDQKVSYVERVESIIPLSSNMRNKKVKATP